MAEQPKKNDSQAQALKAQRAEDGRKAMAEYEAEAVATRAKTERLRALRLAREAEEARHAPAAPARKAATKGKASSGAKAGKAAKTAKGGQSLSAFLKDKADSGFRS